jgi:hypothetical protein
MKAYDSRSFSLVCVCVCVVSSLAARYANETQQHLHMLLKLVQDAHAQTAAGIATGNSPGDVGVGVGGAAGNPLSTLAGSSLGPPPGAPPGLSGSGNSPNDLFGALGPPPGAMPGFGSQGKQNSLEMCIAEIGFLQVLLAHC